MLPRGIMALGFLLAGTILSDSPPPAQHQKSSEARPAKEDQKSKPSEPFWQRTVDDPTAFFTLWLAIFTAVLGVSTIALWLAGEKQIRFARESADRQAKDTEKSFKIAQAAAQAAEKAADAAERGVVAADRAWIEIDISLTGPLVITDKEMSVRARAAFKNVGRSPATNLSIWLMLKADCGVASQYVADITHKHRGMIGAAFGDYGQVLFPNREASREHIISISRSDYMERIKEMDDIPASEGEQKVPFTHSRPGVLAFARYRLPSEGRMGGYHYSTAIFEIGAKDPDHPGFDGSKMAMLLEDMELVATPFSGTNT